MSFINDIKLYNEFSTQVWQNNYDRMAYPVFHSHFCLWLCMSENFTLAFAFIGVVDYLNTEISTSKQKKFSLVTFVDTPGLVDGDMKYPFDVNDAILWLGKVVFQNLKSR